MAVVVVVVAVVVAATVLFDRSGHLEQEKS